MFGHYKVDKQGVDQRSDSTTLPSDLVLRRTPKATHVKIFGKWVKF